MKKRNVLGVIIVAFIVLMCVSLPFLLFPKADKGIVIPRNISLTKSVSDRIGDANAETVIIECLKSGIDSYNYVTNTYADDLSETALCERAIKSIDQLQELAIYIRRNVEKNGGLKLAAEIVKPITRVTSVLPNYLGSESDVLEIKNIGQDLNETVDKYFEVK